jgi:hypothetical protein
MGIILMMKLSTCNWDCKAILLAALILASLCSHGPIGCSARSTAGPSPGVALTLAPDARGEAKLLGYDIGMQGRDTAAGSSGASSLSAFTRPAATTPPSSAGGVGSQRSGDDGRTAPVLESEVDLKTTARRLLDVGAKKASSSGPSCTSNFVPCPPPGRA